MEIGGTGVGSEVMMLRYDAMQERILMMEMRPRLGCFFGPSA